MFSLQAVYKSFSASPVLNGIDFTIRPGETAILIGPSGCGKSTILRLLLGLIQPDSGTVRFQGAALLRDTVHLARRKIGTVIQDGGLFPHLTARENVTLMARELRWPETRIADRLHDLTNLTRFPSEGLGRYPAELSGGQRQRIALMRALMLEPEALLMDEPLGSLDPLVRSELQDDLRRIMRGLGKTTLFVTHDLAEAAFFGDRIVLMREGRIVQQGGIRELIEHPAEPFVTAFFRAQRSPWSEPSETGPEPSVPGPRSAG